MDLWAEADLVASERGLVGREAEAFAERWVAAAEAKVAEASNKEVAMGFDFKAAEQAERAYAANLPASEQQERHWSMVYCLDLVGDLEDELSAGKHARLADLAVCRNLLVKAYRYWAGGNLPNHRLDRCASLAAKLEVESLGLEVGRL